MAVAMVTTDFPEGAGPGMYDAVAAEMGIEERMPKGLIFHWAGYVDGKWTIADIWESRQDFDTFRDELLLPAVQKVSGMDPRTGPQPTIAEHAVHNYVKP
jgi:hypothetical protein